MNTPLTWEYLTLVWTSNMGRREPNAAGKPQWEFWECMNIWRPGAEKSEVHDTRKLDEQGRKPNVLDLLNRLGAEGWELVSVEADRSKIIRSSSHSLQGFEFMPVSDPVRRRYFFKRPKPGSGAPDNKQP